MESHMLKAFEKTYKLSPEEVQSIEKEKTYELSEKVENALLGCRFDKKECEKALFSALPSERALDFMSLIEKII